MGRSTPKPRLNPSEVAFLTMTALQKEGCPRGGMEQLRQEVEAQLEATRHLLERELRSNNPRVRPPGVTLGTRKPLKLDRARFPQMEQPFP